MSLLDLSDLLSLLQCGVVLSVLVSVDRSEHYVSYRALHLVAKSDSLVEVTSFDEFLNLCCELAEAHLTECASKSEETLYTEADNREEESQDKTYNETSLIHSTHEVYRVACWVVSCEVLRCTEYLEIECVSYDTANNEDPDSVLNSFKAR